MYLLFILVLSFTWQCLGSLCSVPSTEEAGIEPRTLTCKSCIPVPLNVLTSFWKNSLYFFFLAFGSHSASLKACPWLYAQDSLWVVNYMEIKSWLATCKAKLYHCTRALHIQNYHLKKDFKMKAKSLLRKFKI